MLTDVVGLAAGILLALSFLPQVVLTWRSKRADDVSLKMLLLTLGSAVLYEVYASLLNLWPVVIMNGVFLVMVAAVLVMKIVYSTRR